MATLSNLVSIFRGKYKTFSDDTKYTDRMIISVFNICRTTIIKQEAEREGVSRQNYIGFCMPLCVGKPIKCPCIAESQCYALVSKYQLPKIINLSGGTAIMIRTANGYVMDMFAPQEARNMNLNPAFKNKPGYYIENYRGERYLVIWNTLDLDVVYIEMIPDNLDDIAAIPLCDGTGNEVADSCIDWTTESYPLDSDLEYRLFQMAENMLLGNAKTNDDVINDTQDITN